MSNRPPVPEGWEFRLSHDRRLFAFYDPGNGPWFVPVPSMDGRFVDSAEMDRLDWYRYVPAVPQPVDQAAALNTAADLIDGEDIPQTAEDVADFCDGARWATGQLRQLAREAASEDPGLDPAISAAEQPPPSGLTEGERAMLAFALNLAQDQIASRGDEFTDDDRAAVASLRRLA